jgi:T5orf172 domain
MPLQKKNTFLSDISTLLLVYLQNPGNISASVMSSNKETQEEIKASLNSLSKSQKTHTTSIYPSPPNSPPRTKPNSSKARRDLEDELRSSGTVSSVLLTPPTSPPRNASKLTPKEEKPAENKCQMNALTLKTKLDLDDWRCGCITLKTKKPCRNPIREKNRDQVNSQIESMITLTQSSPELEAELDKLAMLVHCDWHDYGSFKDSQIEAWTTVFPIRDDDTKPVMSVERQIKKALDRVSAQCIGITVQGERCEQRIGGQKVQNCTKTINEIVKPEVYLDDAYLDVLLKVLKANMYCHIHINKRPLENVASWKSSIMEIYKQADSELVQSIESNAPEGVESQTRAPNTQETGSLSTKMSNNLILQNRGLPTPRNSQSLSPDFNRDPATFWPTAYDTTTFDIIARSDRLADYKSSYNLVQREVTRPLDSTDQKDGYVYLYEVEGNKGSVKLGYTGRSIETRHEEWSFDCNRSPKVLYPIHSGSVMVVPNARRVEALCHAELDHRRIRIYCRGCLKLHIEWFEISPEEAIAVIQKWSK